LKAGNPLKISDLWTFTGATGRGTYALVGFIGFALKHNLDRVVATYVFHRRWGLFNYWVPLHDVARITALQREDIIFLESMVLLSLPFIWVGLALTVKRLRSAGLPVPLVLLFFVPFLNLVFFLLLCLLPARESSVTGDSSSFEPLLPESRAGSAAVAVLVTVPLGIGLVLLGVNILTTYGWGVFVALPFTVGFMAALIYGLRQPPSLHDSLGVSFLAITLLGLSLLAFAIEGLLCILMAAVIALPLAGIGGAFGYLAQRRRWVHQAGPVFFSVILIFVPVVQWTEHVAAPAPPIYTVRTAVDVQASPEVVWKQLVAFSEIPPPKEGLFRSGIAFPIRAEIQGTGVGAERHCVFSTGAFIEPIEVWDEPRRLKFSVTSNPPPMEEWTPYSRITPLHLNNFLVSNGGQFLLTPLSNGGTRLEGTTWYRHSLWPAAYWRLWSDAIIHRIHLRVLQHIREKAENARQTSAPK